MRKTAYQFLTAITCIIAMTSQSAKAQELTTNIHIQGLRSAKGKIMIAVFRDNQAFADMLPFKRFFFDKKQLRDGSMDITIKLAPGTYGLSLLDDEDSNGKMAKSFIGLPKEGFGFSDFYLSGLRRPTYDEFKVALTKDQGNSNIKVRYM